MLVRIHPLRFKDRDMKRSEAPKRRSPVAVAPTHLGGCGYRLEAAAHRAGLGQSVGHSPRRT